MASAGDMRGASDGGGNHILREHGQFTAGWKVHGSQKIA